MKEIAINLSRKRGVAGLSQRKLGELTGLSQQAIASYETGRSTPSIEVVKKMSEVLNCEWWDLYGIGHSNTEQKELKNVSAPYLFELKWDEEGKFHYVLDGKYEIVGQDNELAFTFDNKRITVKIEELDSQLKK